MNDELYAKKWRRRHSLNERAFFNYLHKEWMLQTEKYIKSLDSKNKEVFYITNFYSREWITEILKQAYFAYGIKQFEFLNSIKTKDVEDTSFMLAFSLALASYFSNANSLFVVLRIIESYKDEIKKFVDENINMPKEALITTLLLYLRKKDIEKSALIARTEVTKIMNLSGNIWADLNPKVTKKQWIVTLDGKERKSHGAMADSPAIPLNEYFNVGGYLMSAPGDNSAPAKEVVNCRCGLKFLN